MDRSGLINLLRHLVDREGGPYRNAMRYAEGRTPIEAEGLVASILSEPVRDFLLQQPEFSDGRNLMIQGGGMSAGLLFVVSPQLTIRALRNDFEGSVDWLERIYSKSDAKGQSIFALWGVNVSEKVELIDNIQIIPFEQLPDTPAVKKVKHDGAIVGTLYPTPNLWLGPPNAALVSEFTIAPVIAPSGAVSSAHGMELQQRQYEVARCLSLVGPTTIIPGVSWFQFLDPDLSDLSLSGFTLRTPSEIPIPLRSTDTFDANEAQGTLAKYFELTGDLKRQISLALERFCSALRRRSAADRAVDLCIALEALTSDGRSEIRWKMSLRSALLSATSKVDRMHDRRIIQRLYDVRSSVVHGGVAEGANELFENSERICASVIKNIIKLGKIPDWADLEIADTPIITPPSPSRAA